jgi:hypothetical protein
VRKSPNKGIRNVKIWENMNLPKVNNHTTKDLMDSKGDEISVSELKRMIIRTINEMKEDMQKQVGEIREYE